MYEKTEVSKGRQGTVRGRGREGGERRGKGTGGERGREGRGGGAESERDDREHTKQAVQRKKHLRTYVLKTVAFLHICHRPK